nr:forkhead box protein M1 isoform X2 [Nothobranchius furzeri]
MRRSPRRPLILKRRKLPFQQNEAADARSPSAASSSKESSKPAASQCLLDGVHIMGHSSMSDTQVVFIPKDVDLQVVIDAITAKSKECGDQGPSKFILLSESGSRDNGSSCQEFAREESVPTRSPVGQSVSSEATFNTEADHQSGCKYVIKEASCSPLDDSLTNIQWLGKMDSCALEPDSEEQTTDKSIPTSQNLQPHGPYASAEAVQGTEAERPPYSYMAMIQFAINSKKDRRMTLKEIYAWIEDNFPYYRDVAKPGWKNSIRHNLSLHDMFIRKSSPDGKTSFWTIPPEVNRCLTLDQVYKPCCDPVAAAVPAPMLSCSHQRTAAVGRKIPASSERRMKPLLPRTESYLVPIQLPVASPLYLSTPSASFSYACPKQKQTFSRGAKRVRIAPKVTQSSISVVAESPPKITNLKLEIKEEPVDVPIRCETPIRPPKRQASSSRRKQSLANSLHEEPVLLCPDSDFFDSGVASDVSTFQDVLDVGPNEQRHRQDSPDRGFSFKTPIKSITHLTSSTPSKRSSVGLEPWLVTPVGKGSQNILDFSPIRTPSGPVATPRHEYTTFSLNSTPFKDLALFSSPRELLTTAPCRVTRSTESPIGHPQSSCSRELLQAGSATPTNRSLTEGLVLDLMNDSLSKILVDISFTGLDEELGIANISWSEFIGQV